MRERNYVLLWCSGGSQKTIETFRTDDESKAIQQFRKRVPNLADNGYAKERAGIWCVAEEFEFV